MRLISVAKAVGVREGSGEGEREGREGRAGEGEEAQGGIDGSRHDVRSVEMGG